MNCRDRETTLSALADGETALLERFDARAHLRTCAECRLQLRWLRALKSAAAELPAPAMPVELKAELLARAAVADQERRRKRREAWYVVLGGRSPWGLAAGLAAAVVVVALRLGTPTETVTLDDMLVAHRSYALTMPLTSQETVMSGLADALAGGRP